MKRSFWLTLFAALGFVACSQPAKTKTPVKPATDPNTLLWRISGNGLSKPSYLFGTMHMICANDIELSDSLRSAIRNSDKVYLELDMDDMFQMLGAMTKMSMRDDTTLADLLSLEEYKKVKDHFAEKGGLIPFSMLERYKPMLIGSMIIEQSANCENMIIMENLVMTAAKEYDKEVSGLETMDYQLGIFDSIPYKLQAQQLLKMVQGTAGGEDDQEMKLLTEAYRNQQLDKMDELTKKEEGIQQFTELLLYNRNANWAKKLQALMAKNSLVVAVGAGHLPGEKGVINLLRKAGYKVEPVKNEMIKRKVKEI
ncbi:MAG TPA: TraB/GumN family protein [Flavisolibacter sp.]|nr:TraB/GumN family protein [Flavisolibacter sp.]